MMSPDVAGVIIASVLGISAPVTAAIWKQSKNGNGKYVAKETCTVVQEKMLERHETVMGELDKINGKIDRLIEGRYGK